MGRGFDWTMEAPHNAGEEAEMKRHRFVTVSKSGKKARRGSTKKIRVGSRNPGASRTGSIRHPF